MQPKSLDWLTNQLVFINLDIHCWTGKKSLTPQDLGLDRTQLPPETLVSLGNKQLIDPEALRAFTSIRSAAHRICLAVGTRFMSGYAVPVAKASALLAELDVLGQRYEDARKDFLSGYDSQLATWTQQQPLEWQKLIQNALVPAEYVGGRLGFAVQAVRFTMPDPAVVTHNGFNEALGGLSEQVFREVGTLARETLEYSFQGKTAVTRRALSPLVAIRDKLDGLAFVDYRIQAVIGEINRLIAQIPARGPITNGVLAVLTQFLSLAAQPQGLRTWAENAAVWQAPPELLFAEPPASIEDEDENADMDAEIAAYNQDAEAQQEEPTEVVTPIETEATESIPAPTSDTWFF